MPFSFLNPWLWLGALAIGAPLWLHLRRKQETNLVRFSALRFLDDQPQPRESPLRLRNLLLFLLRALALLLVVAGFTWPYLRQARAIPIKESRVYIFDNTLSHQANEGFAHDRQRMVSEIAKAPADIQVAVVELTSAPRVLVSFGDNREAALEKLKQLQPSFQRGSYLAAFRQANSLLGNSLGERKRIVFLTDNQENQWNENLNSPPFLREVQVELPKPGRPSLPNLSLAEPRVQRVFLGDKSLVNFTVKLSHSGGAKSANIVLRANEQEIFNRAVDLEKQPGTILLQAQWETEPAAWLRGEVSVEGSPDALPADNRVFFSLAPVTEGKVALLAQSHYLRVALSPEIMRGQWAARVLEPSKLADEVAANQDADVLCLESNFLQSGDARKLVSRYLSNGRGVLLMINRVTPAITGCLRELGFEVEGTSPAEGGPEKIQYVLSNHPVFHPFLSPEYGNLTDIKVSKYFKLRSTQAMPLIFSERGAGLFFQSTKPQGKLFVAAFGLDRDSTSWPVHQTFIPFLDLVLQNARAEDTTPVNFEPGEVNSIQLTAAHSTVREVVLHDGSRELARVAVEQGRAQLRLPDHPGIYALTYDESPRVEKMFCVNPSPKESELVYVDAPEAMKIWRFGNTKEPPSRSAAPGPRLSLAGILQQRLWWWMVVGSLVALLLEAVLAEAVVKARN
jgi:hypothetical protein